MTSAANLNDLDVCCLQGSSVSGVGANGVRDEVRRCSWTHQSVRTLRRFLWDVVLNSCYVGNMEKPPSMRRLSNEQVLSLPRDPPADPWQRPTFFSNEVNQAKTRGFQPEPGTKPAWLVGDPLVLFCSCGKCQTFRCRREQWTDMIAKIGWKILDVANSFSKNL